MFVVVLGAGRMGAQIGVEYALGGQRVECLSRTVDASRARVDAALRLASEHGLAPPSAVHRAKGQISFSAAFDGLTGVDLVVESLPEDLPLKASLLREVAGLSPQATIATNTSSISLSSIGEAAGISGRIIATHYWNPPLLMPLVEMLGGPQTPVGRLVKVAQVLRSIGKRPVILEREVPGMLWNRLQSAVLRESLWLVENGVATPDQIDEVVRDGLARRWRLLGPFETVSLGGADVFDAIASNLFSVLSDASSGRFGTHVERDPEALAALARRRDSGLLAELERERRGE
jgi:3-hydroxybutyryl-CoA dehydrogenase